MTGKELKVTKMDNRHTGIGMFSHYVVQSPRGFPSFNAKIKSYIKFRQWFHDSLGPGMEREFALQLDEYCTSKWAWHSVDGLKRIYMTPEAYTLFALTWL